MNTYEVEWKANGMDFNYDGSKTVLASDEESAKTKVITLVSRDLVMARQLIKVTFVKAV